MTVCVLAGASVTVNVAVFVPLLPSERLTSFTDSAEVSSLVIVPVPVASAIVAFAAPLRSTVNDSSASVVSPFTVTITAASHARRDGRVPLHAT